MENFTTFDPEDWGKFRQDAHRMLDDIIDYVERIRERPVWRPIPEEARAQFGESLPDGAASLESVHEIFMRTVLPFAAGNVHPGFMGWVHGAGTPVGMLADMLAAGMNANLGGRNQMPIEVEKQVLKWMRALFDFPETASGLFVTGTSMANYIALLVARTARFGSRVRREGVGESHVAAYASSSAHGSIAQSFDLAGLGMDTLRIVPVNERYEMDLDALEAMIEEDMKAGVQPFFVAGTAGTVDTGAVDDLDGIADCAKRHGLWFHVDGALGALGMLSPDVAPRLTGISRADSIAFDFHKWGQVPYDAGFILVKNGELHFRTFESNQSYLRREPRALAAGSPWPCDFGPDLSRGFRALKTWFTIKVYGAQKLGEAISGTCAVAKYLEERILREARLELLAPVSLNIVCFRYRCAESDEVNAEIVAQLQESGIAAPSTTTLNGMLAIRAAIVNHRTRREDVDAFVEAAIHIGNALTREKHE